MATLYRNASNPNCTEKNEIFIDQNRTLVDIFERHMQIHANGSGDYLCVIKELIVYMSRTFHEENMIMMRTHYPDYLEHAREHEKFTQKVEQFLKSYEQGDDDVGYKIFVFLKDWIRDHTSKLDMACAEYISDNTNNLRTFNSENASFARSF